MIHFFLNGGPLWFRDLALNDSDFWTVWVDRWKLMREGPLTDAAITERIERMRSEISAGAGRNYAKWSGVLNGGETFDGKVDVKIQVPQTIPALLPVLTTVPPLSSRSSASLSTATDSPVSVD